jgi:hypothetical protein
VYKFVSLKLIWKITSILLSLLLLSLLEYSSERWYVEFYEIIIEKIWSHPPKKDGFFMSDKKNWESMKKYDGSV